VIAPLRACTDEDGEPTIDVVALRPGPQTKQTGPEASGNDDDDHQASQRVALISAVTKQAYNSGRHVHLIYDEEDEPKLLSDDDDEGEEQGHGSESVIEYFRCKSFEWRPDPSLPKKTGEDDGAGPSRERLVCVDGFLEEIGSDVTTGGGNVPPGVRVEAVKSQLRVWGRGSGAGGRTGPQLLKLVSRYVVDFQGGCA
jgi:hypothetical protein